MSTVTVLRIEDENGNGPYDQMHWYGTAEIHWPSYRNHSDVKHPRPDEDGLDRVHFGRELYFGFRNTEQLRNWFLPEEGDAEKLSDMGLQITEWSVYENLVHFGGRQLVFYRHRAECVSRTAPVDWEKVTK